MCWSRTDSATNWILEKAISSTQTCCIGVLGRNKDGHLREYVPAGTDFSFTYERMKEVSLGLKIGWNGNFFVEPTERANKAGDKHGRRNKEPSFLPFMRYILLKKVYKNTK